MCLLGDAALKRLEAEQKGGYAAATAALMASLQMFEPNGSVFELPAEARVLFPTVTEDAFLKMSVAERAKMSLQPLLIQGCSKLKEQLANIPQLQAVTHRTASQLFNGTERRSTDTSMNQQPHRHTLHKDIRHMQTFAATMQTQTGTLTTCQEQSCSIASMCI